MSTDRERTAHHEAGHFVASYVLAPSSYRGKLTIRPDEEAGNLGVCQTEEWWTEDMARTDVLTYFVGYASEKRLNSEASPDGSGQDDMEARGILGLLGEGDKEPEWREEANAFVAEHWVAIEALAQELMEVETIRDPFEAELIVNVAHGEATVKDLASYRAHSANEYRKRAEELGG